MNKFALMLPRGYVAGFRLRYITILSYLSAGFSAVADAVKLQATQQQ